MAGIIFLQQQEQVQRNPLYILGYQYDEDLKQYVVIPEEAEIVKRMFRLYLEKVSLRAICDELNDMGYRTINGMLFQEAAINSLLHNEIYACHRHSFLLKRSALSSIII